MKAPMSCRSFLDRIFDFQADELSETEREVFASHRDACPKCARRLEVEDGLLRAVRTRLSAEGAPAELRARVRAALHGAAPAPGRASWAARLPWVVPLVASLVLALLAGPPLWRRISAGPPGAVPFDERVTVVDFECDRAGRSLEEQIRCPNPRHLNAVKTDDGRAWNLSLDRADARRIVADRTLRGHVLRVRGELFPAIGSVRLDDYEDFGPVREVAARLPLPNP